MTDPMLSADAPYHAHIYVGPDQRETAETLQSTLARDSLILFVGQQTRGKAGPHPIPQFEVHFAKSSLDHVRAMIETTGLRALVHPLTDDDLADHTSLAVWIGEPIELDLSTLDPLGQNQGLARFGNGDF
jgi:DOPA 4,5-dioxygenase